MSRATDMKLSFQGIHHDLNQDPNLATEGGLVIHILFDRNARNRIKRKREQMRIKVRRFNE